MAHLRLALSVSWHMLSGKRQKLYTDIWHVTVIAVSAAKGEEEKVWMGKVVGIAVGSRDKSTPVALCSRDLEKVVLCVRSIHFFFTHQLFHPPSHSTFPFGSWICRDCRFISYTYKPSSCKKHSSPARLIRPEGESDAGFQKQASLLKYSKSNKKRT